MIARPKMSQNEWKSTEIRASKVGNFSPFSCPGGTGWPSYSAGLADVEVESNFMEFLAGAELRCGRCGGHLGDRFLDGALFPGTSAFLSGKRYCIDGSALVFYPSGDGAAPLSGDVPAATRQGSWQELPAQWNWRMADGGLRPI